MACCVQVPMVWLQAHELGVLGRLQLRFWGGPLPCRRDRYLHLPLSIHTVVQQSLRELSCLWLCLDPGFRAGC